MPIPGRIWTAIGLALTGVFIFTQDPSSSGEATLTGDAICVVAALFYATYDLRLFKYGKVTVGWSDARRSQRRWLRWYTVC